ncbi:MAG: cellulase family glycosylhydrolase [Cryobacterium sp.]|nr:cellulase family glycosylhydrolase [Cryobacterium sp.]
MTLDRFSIDPAARFIQREGKSVLPIGSHFVPTSGPDWPWRVGVEEFDAAFARMASAKLNTVRIDLIWSAIEPRPGEFDEAHLKVIDAIFDSAEKHGLSLHPTLFVGGEVGDAYWDLPWAMGRNPHVDKELLDYQAAHAAFLARRWRDRDSLIAWDLTDEPPFWPYGSSTTDDDAREWTRRIVEAIRSSDPHHLITIGTASQEIDHGPFRSDVTAEYLDFCSVHPYPIYSPNLYPDSLLSMRMTLAAPFEIQLAAGSGKSVMMHEYGASNTQFSSERIADFDRVSSWGAFGSGSVGFYSWCWTDADTGAYGRAPYVRSPHETQFGMTGASGEARPRLRVMSGMAEVVAKLDLEGRASFGQKTSAAIPVPHEFVRPFDSQWFGLEDSPAGTYTPSELAWNPERNAELLIKGWLNSFVLARRAGIPVSFPREEADGEWPEASLVLVPAPLTTTSNSLIHLRTVTLTGIKDLHKEGRMLYLSCNSETAIPELKELAGVRVLDRAEAVSELELTFVSDFGILTKGSRIQLRGFSADPMHRGVLLEVADAEVLAVDGGGRPVITKSKIDSGTTVLCAYPIELGLAARADAHDPSDDSWRIYEALADESGALPESRVFDSEIIGYELHGPKGGILVAANHHHHSRTARVEFPGGIRNLELMVPEGLEVQFDSNLVTMPPFAVAVFTWENEAGRS